LIPCSGGADSQFAQMWNWYGRGRGIVEMCRGGDRTREMKEDDSGGTFPRTCDRRRAIMVPRWNGYSWLTGRVLLNKRILGPSYRGDRNHLSRVYYHRVPVPQDDQSNPLVPLLPFPPEAAVLLRFFTAAGPTLSVPLLPIV